MGFCLGECSYSKLGAAAATVNGKKVGGNEELVTTVTSTMLIIMFVFTVTRVTGIALNRLSSSIMV